ncbi:TRAP-type C4-dicarboxylate transport system permease small subunit [Bacillus thermophilus]|uniref:TRAP-type C4-dicarboxylate transport system permease small subunit n=1 Tax=Siminovitchia thermophila TaxID=1245522 RepID=A0ABS2R3W5_9BACI|nr:TRAP transporter small permease [Siminovitchia thermophila]MBM7714299.1 TRAP-type C4-dicarboxylate transport system permease small subunit [Siminovitchia thermophila]ONK22201.1 TRAP transporter small permease protein [Bacillus sp. VT-16-64]
MKLLHRLSDILYQVEKQLAIVLCSVMLISLSAGVLYRYVLNSPLTWSDETAIFSLIWLTFIGGSMSIKRQDSAAVSIVMDKLQGKLRQALLGIGIVVMTGFIIYIFYFSLIWLSSSNIAIQRSSSMGMPMIYAYASIPVSFFFMMIHTIELFVNNLKNSEGGHEA